jgi:two-component system, OmpR family, response regulator
VALRVLVVDDEPDIRTVVRATLERHGCAVAEAESGRKVVSYARKHRADIVLLDITMPGVDGYEALAALQGNKRTCDIPIAMLTAMSDMSAIQRAIDAGATGYLTKPFSVDLLYPQMEAIVEKARDDSSHKVVDYPVVV